MEAPLRLTGNYHGSVNVSNKVPTKQIKGWAKASKLCYLLFQSANISFEERKIYFIKKLVSEAVLGQFEERTPYLSNVTDNSFHSNQVG